MGSVSMSCPPVVRRALVRVGALLLVALAVVWGGGWQWSRQRLGPTPADTRRLVEAEARARMARLTGALDAAVQAMAADGALVERAAGGDGPSITALFAAVALDDRGDAGRIAALTVYGVDGAQRLFGRFARLGCGLFVAYGAIGALSLTTIVSLGTPESAWDGARIFGVTLTVIVAYTIVNLLYLLMQIAVAVDDCDAGTGVARTLAFLMRRPREVGIVFGVISTLVALGTAASFLATAALGLIAFVPFVGLAALPLQVGAWMMRGLVFQFLGLTALVAYVRLYREGGGTGA